MIAYEITLPNGVRAIVRSKNNFEVGYVAVYKDKDGLWKKVPYTTVGRNPYAAYENVAARPIAPKKTLKELTTEAMQAAKDLQALWEENSMCSDKPRYQELNRPGGLLRQAEKRKSRAREELQEAIKVASGVPAYMFKELI